MAAVASAPGVTFRRRVPHELPAVYRVLRRSLADYLFRAGVLASPDLSDEQIATALQTSRPFLEHFASTAAEDWVAANDEGQIIGWAISVERDGVLYLCLFFVDPRSQSHGVGRGLLERAFPEGRGRARIIDATQDPRALSLYL